MSLCLINVEKLKSFKFIQKETEVLESNTYVMEIGGYKYKMNFVVYEIDLNNLSSTLKLNKKK